MNVIKIAQEHYKKLGRNHIEIPEWKDAKGDPVKVYYDPVTIDKMAEVARLCGDEMGPRFDACAVIVLALNKEGTRMFKKIDLEELMSGVSRSVVVRIALEVVKVPSIKEAEKNSSGT